VNNQALQTRMLSTYNSMRFGMFAIAAAAPVVIVLWGFTNQFISIFTFIL
jgi:hypothetical protein